MFPSSTMPFPSVDGTIAIPEGLMLDSVRRRPAHGDERQKEDPAALAAAALQLAETYNTPPVPTTFAVWYAFAAGRPETLQREIRKLIDTGGTVSSYEVEQLYHSHLSMTEEQRREQEIAGYRLDHELNKAVGLVQRHMEANDRLAGSIRKSASMMSRDATPAHLFDAVDEILAANSRMRVESARLGHSLEQIRKEVRNLAASLEQARRNEFRDSLTNIANRRYFDRALPRQLREAHTNRWPICLAFADLDHFKSINDKYGHLVGDDVLRYFAALLQKNVKVRDIVARFGGEEFAILLPLTKLADAKTLIERIKTELDQANLVVSKDRHSIGKVTSSFGIVQARPGEEADDFIKRADEKLYEAKNAGRNCIACDSTQDD
ncbi:MAG: GGDEF domain-containing protein [Oricola sp.]